MRLLVTLVALVAAFTTDLPTGQVIPIVVCEKNAAQSYALYLPQAYTPARAWPVIFAFDPGGRGRNPVDRYQLAAEQYGFVVAGSNNSRNGATDVGEAIAAMSGDVFARFQIDTSRVYLAGMSGGARVALAAALASRGVAGVVASSAGYPDSVPRKTLPFPVFATAGTEDFNHLELRKLDHALATPHHLAIFEGGHTWLSSALAVEAVEWLEIQAMRAKLKPADPEEIARIFTKRLAAAEAAKDPAGRYLELQSIGADFTGLEDVTAVTARIADLSRDKAVRAALKAAETEDDREERSLFEVRSAEAKLSDPDERSAALVDLRQQWKRLAVAAAAAQDSSTRRIARRVIGGLSAGPTTADPDYRRIVSQYRTGRGGR